MLVHVADAVNALAERAVVMQLEDIEGWAIELWCLEPSDEASVVACYDDLLDGVVPDPVEQLLESQGVPVRSLLRASTSSKPDITRSDLTELVAAASLVATEWFTTDDVTMPNVPKMSRKKSDSGLDILAVRLEDAGDAPIQPGERLALASVKHTVDKTTGGLRYKLDHSLEEEISTAYLLGQLRVLAGRLEQEGLPLEQASRALLFVHCMDEPEHVDLFAIGLAPAQLQNDFLHQVTMLLGVSATNYTFRMILIPDLDTIHERCA